MVERASGTKSLTLDVAQGITMGSQDVRPSMRHFISLLLVISLSWVTTGYACRMDGLHLVRAVCCCPHGHKAPKAQKATEADPRATVDAGQQTPCCDVVAHAALDDQQPGVIGQVPTLDLPACALSPATSWNAIEPSARAVAVRPPVRGPPLGSGTRTYLTTARLRL